MTTRTPRVIWLQTGDDEESQPYSDGVTWSEDQVNDSDTKYIRADLAEPDPAADPRLVREFKLEAELAASQERVRELERDLEAMRQLLAMHNLGGMTDYDDGPVKRAIAAEQERDALAKGDARYRWIRLASVDVEISNRFVSICESEPQTPELFDAAIDAAISGRDAT